MYGGNVEFVAVTGIRIVSLIECSPVKLRKKALL